MSNTIRIAMAVFAVAALSVAFGWPHSFSITANTALICQVIAAVSLLAALVLRFSKKVKEAVLEDFYYRYFNLSEVERLVIDGKGVFGNIANTLSKIPTLKTLAFENGALESEQIARLGELTQVKKLYLKENPMEKTDWEAFSGVLLKMSLSSLVIKKCGPTPLLKTKPDNLKIILSQ